MKSLLGRLFGRDKSSRSATVPPVEEMPATESDTEAKIEWVRDHIRRDVASGFYDEDTILTHAVEAFEEEFDPVMLRGTAQRFLREEMAAHARDQQNWPARTDCDRLDDAFAALEASGVIARQNFTCCGTCGSAEIWDEIDAVGKAGGPTRGYAFFHMQDTERAAEGDGLYLNYGACEEGEEAALAVANDIVTQLEAHGLRTEWNGSWSQRIAVPLDWKRRR
jgi:hypothetical protein